MHATMRACGGVCMRMHGASLAILGKGQVIYFEGERKAKEGNMYFMGF